MYQTKRPDVLVGALKLRSGKALKRRKERGMLRTCPIKDGRLTKGRSNADGLATRMGFATPDVNPIGTGRQIG